MEVSTLVFDNGAYTMRAGLGGDSEPSCIIPSIIGRPKSLQTQLQPSQTSNFSQASNFSQISNLTQNTLSGVNVKDVFIGADVFSQTSALSLFCPIENRIITNFDDMEKIWNHILFNELKVKPEEHPILMTESPQNTKSAREKTLQIMMETFKVPAFYTTFPEVLSLYSAGLTTGTVVDSGETMTHIVPVYECFAMNHVLSRLDIGGRQINAHLKKILMLNGIELQSANEREILRDIKEKLCYVAVDLDSEMQKIEHINEIEKTFQMPEGPSIPIGAQRFKGPEPLFDPQLISLSSPGLHQMINDTINRCEDLKPLMYGTIMLSGGTSMFSGIAERIEKNICELAPHGTKISVLAPQNRKDSAWIGGSVLVSLATFSQMWITKAEYDETGPSIVHLKCF
ncbi:actin [Tritrichomonas foetus]|uniref:Actin n=1 Tax=Tritrichomonas foetus TaxID=1144522 RepID=A0A1J4JUZ6_9EUKA|nr:actin [Tritrichomonas foetus]|eukprot:OHT02827.1 actin [Tritrichomonas foetus]